MDAENKDNSRGLGNFSSSENISMMGIWNESNANKDAFSRYQYPSSGSPTFNSQRENNMFKFTTQGQENMQCGNLDQPQMYNEELFQ